MHLHILAIGKPKLPFARAGLEEYEGRLRAFAPDLDKYLSNGPTGITNWWTAYKAEASAANPQLGGLLDQIDLPGLYEANTAVPSSRRSLVPACPWRPVHRGDPRARFRSDRRPNDDRRAPRGALNSDETSASERKPLDWKPNLRFFPCAAAGSQRSSIALERKLEKTTLSV